MKSKAIRLFAAAVMITLLMFSMAAAAFADDYMQAYGTPADNGYGVTTYYDGDRTYSAYIAGEGMTCLFAYGAEQNFWIALDNTGTVFEEGSVISVKVQTKADNPDKFKECYEECKIPFKEDASCLVIVSAHKADGTEYTQLDGPVKLYVQLPDAWERDQVQVCYLDDSNIDSAMYVDFIPPDGSEAVACQFEISGLDSTIVMGEKTEDGQVDGGLTLSTPVKTMLIAVACIVGVSLIIGFAVKSRNKE